MLYHSAANSALINHYMNYHHYRIGRNVARALWDYYKILGVIPLDTEGPSTSHGADKNGTCVRSFNLLRLREIEQQRNQSAITFDVHVCISFNLHCPFQSHLHIFILYYIFLFFFLTFMHSFMCTFTFSFSFYLKHSFKLMIVTCFFKHIYSTSFHFHCVSLPLEHFSHSHHLFVKFLCTF